MSASGILFLTICATAPLSLPVIRGVHLIILPAWWRRNSRGFDYRKRLDGVPNVMIITCYVGPVALFTNQANLSSHLAVMLLRN